MSWSGNSCGRHLKWIKLSPVTITVLPWHWREPSSVTTLILKVIESPPRLRFSRTELELIPSWVYLEMRKSLSLKSPTLRCDSCNALGCSTQAGIHAVSTPQSGASLSKCLLFPCLPRTVAAHRLKQEIKLGFLLNSNLPNCSAVAWQHQSGHSPNGHTGLDRHWNKTNAGFCSDKHTGGDDDHAVANTCGADSSRIGWSSLQIGDFAGGHSLITMVIRQNPKFYANEKVNSNVWRGFLIHFLLSTDAALPSLFSQERGELKNTGFPLCIVLMAC